MVAMVGRLEGQYAGASQCLLCDFGRVVRGHWGRKDDARTDASTRRLWPRRRRRRRRGGRKRLRLSVVVQASLRDASPLR